LNIKAIKSHQLSQKIRLKLIFQRMRKILQREKQSAIRIYHNLQRKRLLPLLFEEWRCFRKIQAVSAKVSRRIRQDCLSAIREHNHKDTTFYFKYYFEKLA